MGVHVYDIHGRRVPREELCDAEYFDFLSEDEDKAFTTKPLEDPTVLTSGVGSNCVDQLPNHLRCVMPPAGKLNDGVF